MAIDIYIYIYSDEETEGLMRGRKEKKGRWIYCVS